MISNGRVYLAVLSMLETFPSVIQLVYDTYRRGGRELAIRCLKKEYGFGVTKNIPDGTVRVNRGIIQVTRNDMSNVMRNDSTTVEWDQVLEIIVMDGSPRLTRWIGD